MSQFSAEAIAFALSRSLGLPLLLLPLVAPLAWPTLALRTDYLANLYPAGRLVADGRVSEVYPDRSATSFITAPFNTFAHQLLPDLPATDTAVFMYSPLVGALFAPFSLLSPAVSMLAWQVTSIAALAACAWLLAPVTGRTGADHLWTSLLYLPIFHTLLIGHLGIVLGMLPLCAGYACTARGRPFWGGLAWSLLLLKPQFAPAVLLVIAALALTGRIRCLLGLASGAIGLMALNVLWLSPEVSLRWLSALRLSDTIFSDPRYRYPTYLVTSLPAVALHWFPHEVRDLVKIPSYGAAGLIGLSALWSSWRLMSAAGEPEPRRIARVLLLGIGVLPLVVPHLLSYDLTVLAVAGMIMRGTPWPPKEKLRLARIDWLYVVTVDAYLVLVMLVSTRLARPTVLVAALAFLYVGLLATVRAREPGRSAEP